MKETDEEKSLAWNGEGVRSKERQGNRRVFFFFFLSFFFFWGGGGGGVLFCFGFLLVFFFCYSVIFRFIVRFQTDGGTKKRWQQGIIYLLMFRY